MNLAQLEFRKRLFQRLVAFFQVLQVALLALLDEREDDIYLSAEINLMADALVEAGELGIKLMQGLYRFSARWQFVDDAHVQVAINGHGEGARDRGGSHHEDMRWILALAPQFRSLCHTKAVLLVDDGNAQALEHHGVFQYGMGADQNLDIAGGEVGKNLFSFLSFHDARQQFYPDVHALQERVDGLEMLLGKDFCRCHHACLITVVQGDEHGHECHERLARAYIALQEAVHLSAAAHVGPDFVHHPFLRSRQFEGQMVGIEAVEDVGDAVEDIAPVFASLVAGIP